MRKLFFVTDSLKDNEEIFETQKEAEKHFKTLDKKDKPRLYRASVKNYYIEDGSWNYEDNSDTFKIIKILYEK